MTKQSYDPNTITTAHTQHFSQPPLTSELPLVLPIVVPSKAATHNFADKLLDYFFPIHCHPVSYLELMDQFQQLLEPLAVDKKTVTGDFLAALPDLYHKFLEDAQATLAFDPAANSLEEVIVAYPGFYATAVYRLAHELARLNVPLLPRMLTEYAHSQTGIDIHPTAHIGRAFVIDHGTGLVIGATAHIGHHVKLYPTTINKMVVNG
jgi:serine O-acetyltransferase